MLTKLALSQSGSHLDNVRLLLSTLYSQHYKDTQRAILSLDAQKGFDQVERPFMFESIKCFVFRMNYIEWVKISYSPPVSSILTNIER